jgi:hypothetical protein
MKTHDSSAPSSRPVTFATTLLQREGEGSGGKSEAENRLRIQEPMLGSKKTLTR